jgi:ATP-dependent Lon protease
VVRILPVVVTILTTSAPLVVSENKVVMTGEITLRGDVPPPSTNGKSGIKTSGKKAGVKAGKKTLAKKR